MSSVADQLRGDADQPCRGRAKGRLPLCRRSRLVEKPSQASPMSYGSRRGRPTRLDFTLALAIVGLCGGTACDAPQSAADACISSGGQCMSIGSPCASRGPPNCGSGGFCCLAVAAEGGADGPMLDAWIGDVASEGDAVNSADDAVDGTDAADSSWGVGADGCACTNVIYGPCGSANPCGCCLASGLLCSGSNVCIDGP